MTTDEDEDEFVESHIRHIRKMALLDDNTLRRIFKMKVQEDPSILEQFKENKIKKQYNELNQIAKNINTEPKKIARRVA